MNNEVTKVIEKRCSIRFFKAEPVPRDIVSRLLELACRAPNAGNIQPWLFVVVYNQEVRQQLARAAFNQSFLAEAPVCIVACAQPVLSSARYGKRGRELYCIQDTAAAVENILLAATSFGLASCWVGAFDEQAVARVLELEPEYRPVALVPIGYSRQHSSPRPRRPLEEVVRVIP